MDADYTNASGTLITTGSPQTFSYYPDDLLASSTGRNGDKQARSYDPAGNLTSATDAPSGGSTTTTSVSYYLDGQPRTVSENGSTTTYSYDGAGAPAERQDATGAGTITTTYTYTDNEQPVSISGGVTNSTISEGYDDQARPLTTGYGAFTLTRAWNPDDTLASQTTSNSVATWNYTYDGMYRILAADNNASGSTDCTTNQTSTSLTPVVGLHCFSYDAAGRVASFRDSNAARSATYDEDGNRLTYGDAAHPAVAPVITTSYNTDDSIASQQIGSGTNHGFSYNQPFGGITSDGCSTYSYDGFDRLKSNAGSGNAGCPTRSTINYTYDALDRQTSRYETGAGAVQPGTTNFAYAGLGNQLTSEAVTGGATTRYTLDGTEQAPLAVTTTTGTSQYLADDGHGNTATATTTAGTLSCALRYDPWGSPLDVASGLAAGEQCTNSGGNTPADLQYRSARKDAAAGTYQLGSRTYDPQKAGFLNPDSYRNAPSAADLSVGTDPLTRNTYNYVNGDPVNLDDPTGHMPCLDDGAGNIACGSVSTIERVLDRRESAEAHAEAAQKLTQSRSYVSQLVAAFSTGLELTATQQDLSALQAGAAEQYLEVLQNSGSGDERQAAALILQLLRVGRHRSPTYEAQLASRLAALSRGLSVLSTAVDLIGAAHRYGPGTEFAVAGSTEALAPVAARLGTRWLVRKVLTRTGTCEAFGLGPEDPGSDVCAGIADIFAFGSFLFAHMRSQDLGETIYRATFERSNGATDSLVFAFYQVPTPEPGPSPSAPQ